MRRKTQPVFELVTEVMDSFSEPHGEDVIEDVCIAIEKNPEWKKRYNRLLTVLSRNAVNNAIGYYTKQRAGMKTVRQVRATRSGLIGSYRKLTQ